MTAPRNACTFPRLPWQIILLALMLAMVTGGSPASAETRDRAPTDWFQKGNQAYEQQDFRQAAEFYERALDEDGPAFVLYYNLGNAYYNLRDVGRTILNYERARLLEPRQEDLLFNRRHVLAEAGAAQPEFGRWNFLLENFTLNEMALAATALFWLALLLGGFGFPRAARKRRFPYASLAGAILLGVMGATSAIAAAHLADTRYSPQFAVVTAETGVEARSEPSMASVKVATFSPGSQLFILSTRGKWSYAEFQNGQHGWLPRKSLTFVLPSE